MPSPPTSSDSAVALVIPAYNEAERIGRTLRHIDRYAAQSAHPIHIVIVDDHSTDSTAAAITNDKPAHASLDVIINDQNRGKGYSVRRGMLHALNNPELTAIAFSDADLSTPITELDHLLDELHRSTDVAIASRNMPDSHLEPPQPPLRRALGYIFRSARQLLMLRDILDTQCGFKAFKPKPAKEIFSHCHINGFAFDCELLAAARALKYTIKEVGVTWHNDTRSTLSPYRHIFSVARDLIKIRARFGPQHKPAAPRTARTQTSRTF